MESEAPQPQLPSGSPAAAASYPPWVLLECQCCGDARTAAACRTSAGHPIRVSVRVAPPPAPAESQVRLQVKGESSYAVVVAAHGDSVLIAFGFDQHHRQGSEYFVYSGGAGAARPPSIYLLPPCHCYHDEESAGSRQSDSPRYLHPDATGLIVRPGGDDGDGLVVASLTVVVVSVSGSGLLCWVPDGSRRGLIFCNVLDEAPVLRHVPFPPVEEEAEAQADHTQSRRGLTHDVRAAADGTVRLVTVTPRCCCGGSGVTLCRRSSNAYTIMRAIVVKLHMSSNSGIMPQIAIADYSGSYSGRFKTLTWTLSTDTMAWAMDAMVDATELWALHAAKALPRAQPAYPIIVSADEPHLVFFIVCESFYTKRKYASDTTEWMILVDTRSKTIWSVRRHDRGCGSWRGRIFLPSDLSDYFISSPRCSDVAAAAASSVSKSRSSVVIVNEEQEQLREDGRNLKAAAAASAEETTILAVLQEIPGLAREDMLKAYSILSQDSC
ncbi:hypothetical protein PVAP13_8KG102344 [Panicum virgatum]|uniref:DUF1618 domain-containing protein n=1 Tax=Panicum virgatum TaxID=38727 RepID=A0A8T0PEK2_PANVG|nr:hypothetical protein PVAP13_8KG102344 [Panicum virgatum]